MTTIGLATNLTVRLDVRGLTASISAPDVQKAETDHALKLRSDSTWFWQQSNGIHRVSVLLASSRLRARSTYWSFVSNASHVAVAGSERSRSTLLSISRVIWLCLAIAIVAAALGDAAVEFMSNRGVFGCNDLTDHSNLNVVPTLFAGFFIAFHYLYRRVRQLIVSKPKQGELPSCATLITSPSRRLVRTLPTIYVIQIAVLFVIETIEQYIVGGRLLGGTIWLGGPVPVSLAVHAVVCAGVTFGAGRIFSGLARAAVRFVSFVLLLIAVAARRPVIRSRFAFPRKFRSQLAVLGRSGDRAPPLLTA